jgi:hypothetical protein
MIPHIYHRAPSTARVDDGSAPITTSLGRRPKRAAPFNDKQKAQSAIKDLWQNNPTFTAPGDVDFCSQPKCVDIKIASHDKAKVIIQVDTRLLKKRDQRGCPKSTDTCYYQHTVINRGGSWYIDDMQKITDDQWFRG